MIRVEGLAKSFGDVIAVRSVSFEARDNRVTGLLGPNGAGKTTALRMITPLMKPDAGTVWIDDVDVHARPLEALRRVGVLPDSRGLYTRLTAREHLRYFGELHGVPRDVLEPRIDELAVMLAMESIIDRRVEGFSQGERTKVAIGRALVHDPPNVVLDEPTNGLDVLSARGLRGVVRQLADQGRCVLFSSHQMSEVASLCDEIVVVRDGVVAAVGTPDELVRLTGAPNLEDAFVSIISGQLEAFGGSDAPLGHRSTS